MLARLRQGQSTTCKPGIKSYRKAMAAFKQLTKRALSEIGAAFDTVDGDLSAGLVELILSSRNGSIVLHGVGREGLMMRGLAMRLCHLGLRAHCVGDMCTPPVGPGDLLLVSAGPGGFATVNALLCMAQTAGAHTAVITAQLDGSSVALANSVIFLPARTMADDSESNSNNKDKDTATVLPMGSAYEGALFILGEVLVYHLREKLGENLVAMSSRHTNLE